MPAMHCHLDNGLKDLRNTFIVAAWLPKTLRSGLTQHCMLLICNNEACVDLQGESELATAAAVEWQRS